jgi:hypothetical protein
LMRIRDPGWKEFVSGTRIGKYSDLGSGLNIPDPQHCYLVHVVEYLAIKTAALARTGVSLWRVSRALTWTTWPTPCTPSPSSGDLALPSGNNSSLLNFLQCQFVTGSETTYYFIDLN